MKSLLWGTALIVLLGFASVVMNGLKPTSAPSAPTLQTYRSAAGITFSYSSGYKLEERSDSFEGTPIEVITLIDKNAVIPEMSDGPEAISIIVVPNPEALPVGRWVKEKSISNFGLSPNSVLASTTLAGRPAVAYAYSGLFDSRAVAAASGGKIYILSVGANSSSDPIVGDFQNLLKTVQFK